MTIFEDEVMLVIAVVNCSAGFDLNVFGDLLTIRATDQATVEVEWWDSDAGKTEGLSFPVDRAAEAARVFVKLIH